MKKAKLGDALSARHNSLNFIRLVLAVTVIAGHSTLFGLWGYLSDINGTDFGAVAVYGFFGISGYLIAGSALRNGTGRFLWQRFLRILPAFWACLIVTALGLGVLAWLTTRHACHPLSCYFRAPLSPWGYVYRNLLLQIHQRSIAGLPRGRYDVWVWGNWNGSLWTLFYEFLCYLILGAIAAVGLLRRRIVVLGITVALLCAIAVITVPAGLAIHFSGFQNYWVMNLMRLGSIFLVGSLLYLYREKVPDSGWLALASAALFVATLWLPAGGRPAFDFFTNASFFAPAIAYPLLWLGAHLPFQRIGARNDYSYGIYLYGWPVQQLLAMWGAISWGWFGFTAMSIALTVPLAVGSWWAIEKHALALKKMKLPLRRKPVDAPSVLLNEPDVAMETATAIPGRSSGQGEELLLSPSDRTNV